MNQELRDHYERFETEYLMEIAESDLTDEAREALALVLRNRSVSEEEIRNARAIGEMKESAALAKADRLAPRLGRLIAFAIDSWGCMLLAYLVTFPVLRPISETAHMNIVICVWVAYFLSKDWIPGGSLGKRTLKYRVVVTDTSDAITWWQSFVRNATNFLPVFDWLLVFGGRRMRFGDMLANTEVIRRPPALKIQGNDN